jgi:hypothetical protein
MEHDGYAVGHVAGENEGGSLSPKAPETTTLLSRRAEKGLRIRCALLPVSAALLLETVRQAAFVVRSAQPC